MSDMKLIMEGWREYSSVDEQYDQALAYLLESYDGLLTEGVKDDLLSGMKSLVAQFGKKAVTMALVASITTGALAPGIAAAAETATGVDLPVAAQQMDAEEAKKFSATDAAKALKDIFHKLSKKNLVDDAPEEAPEAAPEPQPEGFSQNAETGDYEFRVAANSYNDVFAKQDARQGMIKNLAEKGLAGLEMSQDGNITSPSGTINGLAVHYDQESSQFVGKWSPERAERAQEMSRQMKQMSR